ncbi:uncharacterized protein LOC122972484 isoform X2 [Thunnus albacares]|uniref:uncharacterized protein LOC122972484 isoform X2 n=1 Tax=Thunnus albacares TaxID=8236 RepID=UPI001CF66B6E|nr:uncharacterized protein LOC122972484 isoform X2 [Thunnus albacares]
MENAQISSYEFDGERHRITARFSLFKAIDPVTTSYLHKLTEEQWKMLATAHTGTDIISLLSDLCQDVVKAITCMIMDNVLPQVYNSMLSLGSSNTSTTMSRIDASEMDLSDYLVSEEAMQCCIRDTLNVSLAEGMGVKEESSHNANKLLELVAGEVTRRVNHSITDFFYAPSFPPLPQSGGSDISCQSLLDDMVYHTAQIMHGYIWREKRFEETSQDSEFSEFSSVDEATDSEELNAEDAESICSEISDVSSPEKVTSPVESIQTAIKPIIKSSLHKITEEQWEFLATDHTDTDTIRLLSGLCLDIVDKITHIVHKEMFARVRFRMHQTGSSNTSIIMNSIRESESHWFHYMVHEKITKVHIGTCLHWSVGAGMGVEPKRSHNTDKLLVLVSAEVTRRVNLSLAEIFSSTAFPELHKAVESNIYNKSLVDDMVYHMVQILRWCLWRRKRLEEGSPDDDPNLYSGADSIDDIEEFDAEDAESISSSSESSVLPEFSGPDEVTSVEEFDAEDAESICSSSESSVLPEFSGPDKVTSPVESIQTAIKPIIKSSLHKITEELLSGLCLDIVDKITHIVHKEMFSRVRFRMHQTGSSNTSIIMNSIRESESHWFHYMVHEKITKVHIGTCLHWSVGAGMGVEPKRSHNTDKLLVLVSAEVTRRVNLSLAEIFSSTAFPELHKAVESNIYNKSLVDDMVYHMVQILRWCLWRRKRLEEGSPDDDPNLYSGADSIDDIEEFDAEDAESISSSSESSVLPEFSGPDEVTSVEEFDAEDAESICSSSESSVLPEFSGPDEVTSVEEFKAEDAESICSSSEGSACSFDIIKASPRPAVDVSRIENFSGQKSTGRISTFVRKVRRFFRRNTARVNPACEVIQLENGSTQTPPPKKKKRPAVTRMFSSLAKVLRKPFTSCISGGSQDD